MLIKVTFYHDLKTPIKHLWWRLFNARLRTRSILQYLFTESEIQKKQFHSSSQNVMGTQTGGDLGRVLGVPSSITNTTSLQGRNF